MDYTEDRLCGHQQRIPKASIGGRISQIKLGDIVDGHPSGYRGSRDVDPFRDIAVTGGLSANESPAFPVYEQFDPYLAGTWVIRRAIVGFDSCGGERDALRGGFPGA